MEKALSQNSQSWYKHELTKTGMREREREMGMRGGGTKQTY
jgi:hypothetical protein